MKSNKWFTEKIRIFVTNWIYHEFKFFGNFCHELNICHELERIFVEVYTKEIRIIVMKHSDSIQEYKQIKRLFQKSQFTNLVVFEKLFGICGTIHLLASLQQLLKVRLVRGCENFPWKLIDGRKKLALVMENNYTSQGLLD